MLHQMREHLNVSAVQQLMVLVVGDECVHHPSVHCPGTVVAPELSDIRPVLFVNSLVKQIFDKLP